MDFIPADQIGIKVDPFYYLKTYFLTLWGHHGKVLFFSYVILALKIVSFTTRSIYITKIVKDPEALLEVSATYPIPLLAIVKMTFLLLRRKNVHFLYSTVTTRFWNISQAGPIKERYWQNRFFVINSLLLGHFITSNFYVVLHLMLAKVPIPEGRTRWLPVLVSVPFNTDESPTYQIMYGLLTWNMFISVIGNGFFDLLFAYAAQHLSAQFTILKVKLKMLERGLMEHFRDAEKFRSEKFQWDVHCRLAVCVKHHNLLLRYGNELQNLTSVIFGIQLMTTLLTLVLVGYTLSENLEELTKSTMLMSFVFSSVMQFSIFAVQCADIQQQSSSVAEAAYQCNWYLFNARVKRGLTLLIMNSQKGIRLYGAGLVVMDNAVIIKMGQKVFSCITLLRSLAQ